MTDRLWETAGPCPATKEYSSGRKKNVFCRRYSGKRSERQDKRYCLSYKDLERGGSCQPLKLRQMGTQRVHMEGNLLGLVCWARRAGTRDLLSCLGCWSRTSTKYFIFFLTGHYFTSLFPSPRKASRAIVARLLSQYKYLSKIFWTPPLYPLFGKNVCLQLHKDDINNCFLPIEYCLPGALPRQRRGRSRTWAWPEIPQTGCYTSHSVQ